MGWRSRPFIQALTVGLVSGAVYGVLQGLGDASIGRGAFSGLFFGAIMGAVQYAGLRANAHLAGLRPREKRMVMVAVRRGLPVADPSLASAAVRQAQNAQVAAGRQRSGAYLAWALLAISVVALGLSVASTYLPGVGVSTFSAAVWLVILVLGPKLDRHFRDRAHAAEEANSQLLQPPPGGLEDRRVTSLGAVRPTPRRR